MKERRRRLPVRRSSEAGGRDWRPRTRSANRSPLAQDLDAAVAVILRELEDLDHYERLYAQYLLTQAASLGLISVIRYFA